MSCILQDLFNTYVLFEDAGERTILLFSVRTGVNCEDRCGSDISASSTVSRARSKGQQFAWQTVEIRSADTEQATERDLSSSQQEQREIANKMRLIKHKSSPSLSVSLVSTVSLMYAVSFLAIYCSSLLAPRRAAATHSSLSERGTMGLKTRSPSAATTRTSSRSTTVWYKYSNKYYIII